MWHARISCYFEENGGRLEVFAVDVPPNEIMMVANVCVLVLLCIFVYVCVYAYVCVSSELPACLRMCACLHEQCQTVATRRVCLWSCLARYLSRILKTILFANWPPSRLLVHTYTHAFAYVCVCVYAWMHVCVCTHTYTYATNTRASM